ncbi:Disease resistance protein RPM1 [Acorus gramineus]|uniref:Disease resistance protein RPM1 n=1 Tax=Acorus gramineus TaxID=55184 RepID=A0AAV9BQG5_ACOGR|nr:Disease resistance protein RPM1 [Acorus gramineus]
MEEGLLGSLIVKIVSALAIEAPGLARIREEMEKIKGMLEAMQPAFIGQVHRMGVKDEPAAIWVRQVKEMALDIEDIVDEFVYLVDKHEGGIFGSLKKCTHRLKKETSLSRIFKELKGIIVPLEDIGKKKDQYDDVDIRGEPSMTIDDTEIRRRRAEASQFVCDEEVFGVEEYKIMLIKWLIEEANCKGIALQGLGGSGKTTLAAYVYNNQEVKKHFECRAWVIVSRTYNIDNILGKIMKQFLGQERDTPDPERIERAVQVQRLHDYVQRKSCVIVFDDIWSLDGWGVINDIFPESMCTSKIIYTTRNYDIASLLASQGFVFKMQPLTEEAAWSLFCRKAFCAFRGRCPPQFEELARELVKKCQGLPLAIVVLAGLMYSKTSLYKWQNILDFFMDFLLLDDPRINDILKLSFEDLPYQLKNCFLYCSAFPEDFSIRKERIVRLWVAEGFVECKEGMTMEEVAECYLDELISRSLLPVVEVPSHDVLHIIFFKETEAFRMHDLVREMAITIFEEENFCMMYNGREAQLGNKTRRLSLHGIKEDDVLKIKNKMPHLRTLMMFESDKRFPPKALKNIAIKTFRSLRVLDLEGLYSNESLPDAVGNLFNLRFLSMRSTRFSRLPETISRLHNLQTLDIRDSEVEKLPNGITKLKKLRHLILNYNHPPRSISYLKDIQTLINITAKGQVIQEVGNLTQLRSLRIVEVRASDGEKLCASLNKLNCLVILSIRSENDNGRLQLETLTTPQYLSELILLGRLEVLPRWFDSLANLTRLDLLKARLREDMIPSFQSLPKLAYLHLYKAFDGKEMHFQAGGFPSLIELQLNDLLWLNKIKIEDGAMKRIKMFKLLGCEELKMLPMGIEHLTTLQELRIFFMPEEFVERLRPDGEDRPKVSHIPFINLIGDSGGMKDIDRYFSERDRSP